MADQATWRKNLPEGFDGRHGDGKEWDSEISVKPILWSTVAIVVSFVFALGFCWALIGFLDSKQPEVEVSPIAEANERRLPARPWIQPKPEMELDAWLAQVNEQLTTYGWVDPLDERVRIPVKRAMELVLAERGHGAATTPATPAAIEPGQDPPVDVPVDESASDDTSGDENSAAEPGDSNA